jgi:hypothetical protein
MPDGVEGTILGRSQRERKIAEKGGEKIAFRLLCRTARLSGGMTAQRDQYLNAEKLAECQFPSCRFKLIRVCGKMNGSERRRTVVIAMGKGVGPSLPVSFAERTVNQSANHPHTDSLAGRMHGNDSVEMNALPILLGDDLKLRVLHTEALSTPADASVDDETRSGENGLLNMEEVEPAERQSSR